MRAGRIRTLGGTCIALLALLKSGPAIANPCDGIWRKSLSEATALITANEVQKSLGPPRFDHVLTFDHVFEHMSDGSWHIVWAEPHNMERGAFFITTVGNAPRFVTVWGGAARKNERKSVADWALAIDPRFPHPLADCFAWYATIGRDSPQSSFDQAH